MKNITIIYFLLFLLSKCEVECTLLQIKVIKDDFIICPISVYELYTIDTNNKFFKYDSEKFKDSSLIAQYFLENTVDGYYYLDQPKAKNEGFFLDDFINRTINDGYAHQNGANVTGAEVLGTYLCSYTFIESKKYCNILCDPFVNKVAPFTYANVQIVPKLDECLENGSPNDNCSVIGLIGYLGNFKPIVEPPTYLTTDQNFNGYNPPYHNSAIFSKNVYYFSIILFLILLILTN